MQRQRSHRVAANRGILDPLINSLSKPLSQSMEKSNLSHPKRNLLNGVAANTYLFLPTDYRGNYSSNLSIVHLTLGEMQVTFRALVLSASFWLAHPTWHMDCKVTWCSRLHCSGRVCSNYHFLSCFVIQGLFSQIKEEKKGSILSFEESLYFSLKRSLFLG